MLQMKDAVCQPLASYMAGKCHAAAADAFFPVQQGYTKAKAKASFYSCEMSDVCLFLSHPHTCLPSWFLHAPEFRVQYIPC